MFPGEWYILKVQKIRITLQQQRRCTIKCNKTSPRVSSVCLLCVLCQKIYSSGLFEMPQNSIVNNLRLYTMSLSGREKLHAALQSLYILFAMCKLCDALGHVKFDKPWVRSLLSLSQWQWTASGRRRHSWSMMARCRVCLCGFVFSIWLRPRRLEGWWKRRTALPSVWAISLEHVLIFDKKVVVYNRIICTHLCERKRACVCVGSLVICYLLQSASEIESGSALCL